MSKEENHGCLWGLLFGWWGVLFEALFGSSKSTKSALEGALIGGLFGINDIFDDDK